MQNKSSDNHQLWYLLDKTENINGTDVDGQNIVNYYTSYCLDSDARGKVYTLGCGSKLQLWYFQLHW